MNSFVKLSFSARHLAIISLLIILAAGLLPGRPASAQTPDPASAAIPAARDSAEDAPNPPPGVDGEWWAAAQEQIRRAEYDVTWQEATGLPDLPGAYQAPNRSQELRTYFAPAGISIVPRALPAGASAPPWRLDLALSGYGAAAGLTPAANRVEYRRPGLIETYVNDEQGLMQRLTLAAAPADGFIVFDSGLAGELAARLAADGSAIEYAGRDGAAVLRYGDLQAADAGGRPVQAWLALGPGSRQVRLGIAAATAAFPVEISARLSAPVGLPAAANWTAEGGQVGAEFGKAVGTAGDVNGDGYDDVIVGARSYDNGQTDEGAAFVYHGSPAGLDATPAWMAESDEAYAWFGVSVGTAGDVNGDGYDDVIVGAYGYNGDLGDEGAAFVYYGSAAGLSTVADWRAEGDQAVAQFGFSVGTAGDVNGDGYDDVIAGAHSYDNPENAEGAAFVYYGSAGGLSPTVSWMAESNQAGAFFGWSVGTAGDVNGDGYDDVIAGAYGYEINSSVYYQGAAFVYYGGASGLEAAAAWRALGVRYNDYLGFSVGTAGDVNGDGYDDVIAGAYGYDNGEDGEGGAFVYYGSETGLSTTADWTGEGNQAGDYFGWSVGTAGDVNDDGCDEVIVGALYYDNPETNEGRAFVYYGSMTGLSTTADWTAESDQAGADFGWSVGTAGDVNGDGHADVIVGAPYYDNPEDSEGGAFAYYGSCTAGPPATPAVAVTRSGNDILLTWGADAANVRYQVWVSTSPYFDPAAPGGVTPVYTGGTTYIDTGAAASLVNHFYVVRGLNACGAISANSVRRGKVTFGLTPGME